MLFIYYLLARHEESRMLAQHGESYRVYMEHTGMFLPGNPGGKIFRLLLGWINSKRLSLGLTYMFTLALFILAAFGLRSYTISKTSIVVIPEKHLTAVSITPKLDGSIKDIVNIAFQNNNLRSSIENYHKQGHKGFMVHIMPVNYMMQGLFTQPDMSSMHKSPRRSFSAVIGFMFPFLGRRNHQQMIGLMGDGPVRLIFSQLTWPNGQYASADNALAFTVKHLPLLRVDVDTSNSRVLNVDQTAPRNYWGQMPMPAF
jgi:hypothetical protein